mgnify:CR=1 FL=1
MQQPHQSALLRRFHRGQQQYQALYEVVVVYIGGDTDYYDELQRIRDGHSYMRLTKMGGNERLYISTKQALNVGIKAAHYDNVILSTQSAEPASPRWLELMARGFESAEVVIPAKKIAYKAGVAYMLNVYAHEAKEGKWTACPDFCYWNAPIVELAGKTMGIVGLGNIGMAVARIALSFGMKVLAATSKPQAILPEGITASTPQEVLANADIVSLHCPLTDNTRELINADSLKTMKHSAILINTGRGPLINEQHLANALNNGEIAAFGADVLSIEPARADNPLLKANNCFITPHIAWATTEARTRLMNIAVENVRQFANGETVLNAL